MLGYRGEGEAPGFAKEKGFAEQGRDAVYFAAKDGFDFRAAEGLFGGFGGVGQFEGDAVFVGAGVVKVGEAGAAGFAEAHEALVDHDAAEPGGESAIAFEAAQVEENLGKGVLDFIFGVFEVAEDGAGEFEAGVVVAVDEFGERVGVAAPG